MHSPDSTRRFSDRVENYVRYRPTYPEGVLKVLRQETGLSSEDAIAVGIFYIITGIFGATVGSLFAALPAELILAIAGLALLGTIGKGLAVALVDKKDREAALITFLVTASGMALFGIGSAFWGLAAGVLSTAITRLSVFSRLS